MSLTTSETTNFTTCFLSKQLGAKRTIARISNTEFIKDCNEIDFDLIGIDELISPENLAADEIKSIISESAFTNSHDFDDGILKMMAVRLEKNAPFIGKTVMEAASVFPGVHFMPIALKREDSESTIIPRGNTIFCECDHVYFITNKKGLKEKANERKYIPLCIDIWDQFASFYSKGNKRIAYYKKYGYDIEYYYNGVLLEEKEKIVELISKNLDLSFTYQLGIIPEQFTNSIRIFLLILYNFIQWSLVIKYKQNFKVIQVENQIKEKPIKNSKNNI